MADHPGESVGIYREFVGYRLPADEGLPESSGDMTPTVSADQPIVHVPLRLSGYGGSGPSATWDQLARRRMLADQMAQ